MRFRHLHLSSGTWRYFIGRRGVLIYGPEGQRMYAPLPDVTGLTSDAIERGKWKGWFSVAPSTVRKYIEARLNHAT